MATEQGPGRLEAGQVRAMFDRIAAIYDLMNGAMSAGMHHRWRARAAEEARVGPGSSVLDVACGTGDFSLELARRVAPGGLVVGSDFSEAMLARARCKGAHTPDGLLRFEWGDALELPYGKGAFDAATVGFGVRNFADLERGLAELVRVVRPGGRVVVLEFTTPTRPPLSLFYRVWFDRLVPVLGRIAGTLAQAIERLGARGGDGARSIGDAYRYLPSSVKRFPAPRELAELLDRAGLVDVHWVLTAGGIVTIHAGTVYAEDSSR